MLKISEKNTEITVISVEERDYISLTDTTYAKESESQWRLKLDNNLAENAIRPIALSRKNFMFCGNHEAAGNTAIIVSTRATTS